MTVNSTPCIIGIGAAHIDRRGRVSGVYWPAVSNPGTMREEAGGAVFNALRTIVRRGLKADIVAAIGGDAAGALVGSTIAACHIGDHCGVFLDRATASYTALLDENGDLVAGLADMDIHETALPRLLRRKEIRELAAAADALLIDANLPASAIPKAVALANGKPVYAIAVSPAKVLRLKQALPELACLFMNRAEAAALTGLGAEPSTAELIAALRDLGLNAAAISDGAKSLAAFDSTAVFELDPPKLLAVTDVTGAGDALAGAAAAALARGQSMADAMREGTAAAFLALGDKSAAPEFDDRKFAETLAKIAVPAKSPGNLQPEPAMMADTQTIPLHIHAEVRSALDAGQPVVALESTIITHGMPWPQNAEMAAGVEAIIRAEGAVPATIAVIGGRLHVGLDTDQLETLAQTHDVLKLSRADLAHAIATGATGGTTVAATMIAAHLAGISVFATGGIGGVHRGAEESFDISADLDELARTPVIVVSAGPKAILDIGKTLEVLETRGVPVIGYGTSKIPAFWSPSSEHEAPIRYDSAAEIARFQMVRSALGIDGGMLVVNPVPAGDGIAPAIINTHIEQALKDANKQGVTGKAVTPYLLGRIFELTDGKSLAANIALVENNARLAARIATELAARRN